VSKNNFSHVLINGCSHSAGSEIEGSGIGEGNYNRENSFGAQFAKQLGCTYTNIAYPGASNDYIARTTLYWMLDNKELAKNTLFLIHWTGTDRTEYFYDAGSTTAFDFIPFRPDTKVTHLHPQHYPEWAPSQWQRNLDVLSNHLFINPVQWNINRYNNIIQTQEFLKAHGCKYVFRNAFQCCDTSARYTYYAQRIDKQHFLDYDNAEESFYEHCLNKGYGVEGQQYWHHKLDAHTYWANRLFSLL
jgi:hypothetical protein